MPKLSDEIRSKYLELVRLADAEEAKYKELQTVNEALHKAYLRIRDLIGKEAFDTPHAPTAEQIYETTEAALKKLVKKANAP